MNCQGEVKKFEQFELCVLLWEHFLCQGADEFLNESVLYIYRKKVKRLDIRILIGILKFFFKVFEIEDIEDIL